MADLDLSRYIDQPVNAAPPDFTHAFAQAIQAKQWADSQDAQRSQFAASQAQQERERQAELAMRAQQLDAENRRYALGQSTVLSKQAENEARHQHEEAVKLADSTRQMVAHGRYSEALSNIGMLRDLGVDATATKNDKGEYRFHIGVPTYKGPVAPSAFGDLYGNLSGGPKNPYEALPGSAQALAGPIGIKDEAPQTGDTMQAPVLASNATGPLPKPAPEALGAVNPFAAPQAPGDVSSLVIPPSGQGEVSPAPPVPQGPAAPPTAAAGGPAPGDLDTGELARMNASEMGPALQGIVGAMIPRYQGNAAALATGMSAMHDTPQGTLSAMEPFVKNAVSNWNAEMNAEAQANKASQSQSSSQMNDAREREFQAQAEANRVGKEQDLANDIRTNREADEVIGKLKSGNRNAQADAVKQMLAAREGHHITDKDYEIAVNGVVSWMEKNKIGLERIYHDGLPLSVQESITAQMQMAKGASRSRVQQTGKQMEEYAAGDPNEASRTGTMRWIKQHIPPDLQSETAQRWNPNISPGPGSSQRSSSSGPAFSAPPGDLGRIPLPPNPLAAPGIPAATSPQGEESSAHPDDEIDKVLE